MSETVKCDVCGKTEDGNKSLNGFSRLSFYRKEGNRITIDVCWEDSQKMIDLILNWVKKEHANYERENNE